MSRANLVMSFFLLFDGGLDSVVDAHLDKLEGNELEAALLKATNDLANKAPAVQSLPSARVPFAEKQASFSAAQENQTHRWTPSGLYRTRRKSKQAVDKPKGNSFAREAPENKIYLTMTVYTADHRVSRLHLLESSATVNKSVL